MVRETPAPDESSAGEPRDVDESIGAPATPVDADADADANDDSTDDAAEVDATDDDGTDDQPSGVDTITSESNRPASADEPTPTGSALPGRLRDRREHLEADRRGGTGGDEGRFDAATRDPVIPSEILDRQTTERTNQDHTPGGTVRHRVSPWRRLWIIGAVIPAVVITYFVVSLWQVWSTGNSDEARPVDAIVVMGAAQYDGTPSPQLAARLDHVATLWPDDLAPLVVVTGGNQPGDRFTEAEASANYLMGMGVPERSIIRETSGSTSYESLEQVHELLLAAVGENPTILIVTDPYHALRSELIAEEVGMQASVSPTPTSVVTGARSLERHVYEAGGVAIGRITGFRWLSDITS